MDHYPLTYALRTQIYEHVYAGQVPDRPMEERVGVIFRSDLKVKLPDQALAPWREWFLPLDNVATNPADSFGFFGKQLLDVLPGIAGTVQLFHSHPSGAGPSKDDNDMLLEMGTTAILPAPYRWHQTALVYSVATSQWWEYP